MGKQRDKWSHFFKLFAGQSEKIVWLRIIGISWLIFVFILASFLEWDESKFISYLQFKQQNLLLYIESHFFLSVSLFFLFYVLITSLSIPGSVFLTILAGALFGLSWGVATVALASSLGANISFLMSRFLFRSFLLNHMNKKLKDKIAIFEQHFKKDGAWYLLSLRLAPVFPYVMTNLLMGITSIPMKIYFFVSFIGMLPSCFVYVYAGTELAKVKTIGDIISFPIFLSLLCLGLFPFLGMKLISYMRTRRS